MVLTAKYWFCSVGWQTAPSFAPCSQITSGKFLQQLHMLKTSMFWVMVLKCGFTIDSTSTQIGTMAEEVEIFLKMQLLQWKVTLILQTQMNIQPSPQWPLLGLGPLELLKLLVLEIPPLRLILLYQVIWTFDIWFAFPIGRNNAYFHIVKNVFPV